MPPRISLTKEFIRDCFLEAAQKNPNISFTEFVVDVGFSHQSVIREFGSWNNLRTECGFKLNKPGPKKRR